MDAPEAVELISARSTGNKNEVPRYVMTGVVGIRRRHQSRRPIRVDCVDLARISPARWRWVRREIEPRDAGGLRNENPVSIRGGGGEVTHALRQRRIHDAISGEIES